MTIEHCIARVHEEYAGNPTNLSGNQTKQDAIARAGHLARPLADTMKKMVGFRNVAVHDYQSLERHLGDLREFATIR